MLNYTTNKLITMPIEDVFEYLEDLREWGNDEAPVDWMAGGIAQYFYLKFIHNHVHLGRVTNKDTRDYFLDKFFDQTNGGPCWIPYRELSDSALRTVANEWYGMSDYTYKSIVWEVLQLLGEDVLFGNRYRRRSQIFTITLPQLQHRLPQSIINRLRTQYYCPKVLARQNDTFFNHLSQMDMRMVPWAVLLHRKDTVNTVLDFMKLASGMSYVKFRAFVHRCPMLLTKLPEEHHASIPITGRELLSLVHHMLRCGIEIPTGYLKTIEDRLVVDIMQSNGLSENAARKFDEVKKTLG
jgi:hypothetical protein